MAEGSLEFVCGSLGSGKTSMACDLGLEHLVRGGSVGGNVEWFPDKVGEWMHREHGLRFDPDRLYRFEDGPDFWKHVKTGSDDLESMIILDETHVEHGARNWVKTTAEEILFNTMARKLNVRVIYITQDINNADKQFRRMAQRIWYCRNLAQVRILGLFNFPFPMFFRVPYFCGPGVPPQRQQPEVVLRPQSWGLFKTKSLVGRAAATFSILEAAKSSPLERIPKPSRPFPWHVWAPIGAAAAEVLLR